MQIEDVTFPDGLAVDSYGPGFFRINGQLNHNNIFICGQNLIHWSGLEDTDTLLQHKERYDVLFIGMGNTMAYLPREFKEQLEQHAIALEPMTTPGACRTYNVLLSEGRRVALAALVTS